MLSILEKNIKMASYSSKYDTIVIGCGAAGLAAISKLGRAGKKVLGLEAAPKIGGRVCTENFGNGIVELGAEWIHGTENSVVYSAAMQQKLNILHQDIGFTFLKSDGSKCEDRKLNELMAFCFGVRDDEPDTPQPTGHFIKEKCDQYVTATYPDLANDKMLMNEFYEFINLLVCNYDAANDWNDISTSADFQQLEGHQHKSWGKMGYKTLFDVLLNTPPFGTGYPTVRIAVNEEVTNINWGDNNECVTVTCGDGCQYLADNVIVTVSIGVLKERHHQLFTPPLPKYKMDAIQRLSIGVMDKIILSYDSVWWPKYKNTFFGFIWNTNQKDKVANKDKWITKIFGMSRPMGCDNAVTLWTSGEIAKLVENLPEEEVVIKCTELLRKFFNNKSIPLPAKMLRSKWYSNPFTKGSYSYDSLMSPYYPTARSDLASPLYSEKKKLKVLFAGEATNVTHYSTVHGAMETGYSQADVILNGKVHSKL